MRNVILQEFVSLDGLAAGPKDSVDFVPASNRGDKSFGKRQLDFMDSVDAILLGRVTYDMFSGYWPNVTDPEEKEFAAKINAMQKIVFSKTLQRAPWGKFAEARIVKTNASEEVAKLRQSSGKDMVIWGSISVAQSLIAAKLIDQYQLILCPVLLGNGKPLFANNADQTNLKLLNSRSFDRGAVLVVYAPAK